MPQLDKITFLSQIGWFIILFLAFYQILLQIVLPNLVTIFKARHKISQVIHKSNFVLMANRPNNDLFLRTISLYSIALIQANFCLSKSLTLFKNLEETYVNTMKFQYFKNVNQTVYNSLENLIQLQSLIKNHYFSPSLPLNLANNVAGYIPAFHPEVAKAASKAKPSTSKPVELKGDSHVITKDTPKKEKNPNKKEPVKKDKKEPTKKEPKTKVKEEKVKEVKEEKVKEVKEEKVKEEKKKSKKDKESSGVTKKKDSETKEKKSSSSKKRS